MNKISESLGYARGLLKSMDSKTDSVLYELLNALVDGMDAQAQRIAKLDELYNELDEYVESIDDDLTELEESCYNAAEGDEFEEDDFPFDDEDDQPLRLLKSKHTCKCGHHHDEDHECHCHEDGHECHCHDDDCDCDCDDDEFDEDFDEDDMDLSGFDNLFLGVMCPDCGRMFCVTDEDFDAPGALYHCPFCEHDVHVSPIDPKNVPVAKRVK